MAVARDRRAFRHHDRRCLPAAARGSGRQVSARGPRPFWQPLRPAKGFYFRSAEPSRPAAGLRADRRSDPEGKGSAAMDAFPRAGHSFFPRGRQNCAISRREGSLRDDATVAARLLLGPPDAARRTAVRRGRGQHGRRTVRAHARARHPRESGRLALAAEEMEVRQTQRRSMRPVRERGAANTELGL